MRSVGWLFLACTAVWSGAAAADLTAKELAAAQKLYVAKCAKCHRFYEPNTYNETDWQRWMDRMNRKSKLKPPQAELLDRYLGAYRAGKLPGKPEAKPKGA